MKSTNNVVHTVTFDTFVMGLYDLANDDTTVKFMVTKNKNNFVIFIIFLSQ